MAVNLGPFRVIRGLHVPVGADVIVYGLVARDSPKYASYVFHFDNPQMQYEFYELGTDGYSELEPGVDPLTNAWAMTSATYEATSDAGTDFHAHWGMFIVPNISKDFPDPNRNTIDLTLRTAANLGAGVTRRGILRMEAYRKPSIPDMVTKYRAMPTYDWLTVDDFWRELEFNSGLERVNIVDVNFTHPETMANVLSIKIHEKNMDTIGPTVGLI